MQITSECNVTFSSYLIREGDGQVLILFLVNLLRVLYYYCDVAVSTVAAINRTIYITMVVESYC